MAVSISQSLDNKLTRIGIGDVALWFSYETLVAFQVPGSSPVVSENVWGTTTGKHLNAIDYGRRDTRVPYQRFTELVRTVLEPAVNWQEVQHVRP